LSNTETSNLTFSVDETAARLAHSLETIEWAVGQIPEAYTHKVPDFYEADEWGVAMNLAHLIVYDEGIANPILGDLAKGGDGLGSTKSHLEHWFAQDALDIADQPIDHLMSRFADGHRCQIEIAESFSDEAFNQPATLLFADGSGMRSGGWIATKTFQHAWEHGNAILRMELFAPRS
jgi:hypothetical protein